MGLGDPHFVNTHNLTEAMLSKAHAAYLRRRLRADKTFPYTHYEDQVPLTNPVDDQGTTHISVVDPQGNAVSMTSTVNLVFGSKVMSPGTGVLFNDQMDDFSIPGRSNAFDLPPSEANFIKPGKKPLSSMSPTIILKDCQLYLIIGASGGSRIITGILQALLNVVDFSQDLYTAVSRARMHHQLLPTSVHSRTQCNGQPVTESSKAFSSVGTRCAASTLKQPPSISETILPCNHQLDEMGGIAVVQAILVSDSTTNNETEAKQIIYAVSDPRKHGSPAGF